MNNKIKSTDNELNYTFTLSQISHEINNPLTLIYSTIQLLALKYPELNKDKLWSQLLSDINYLKQLTKSLSTFNHCSTLDIQSVNLEALLTDLAASWYPVAVQSQKQFIAHIPKNLPKIQCDAIKLQQCLINLIKNSFEATNVNDTIEITVLNSDTDITITVSDTGKGLAESQIQHIFEPFTSYKSDGTGLGLCITEKVIEAHHGTVGVSSIPGGGTSFTVKLPITQP